VPEILPIKQRIESLIERGYIERDENDKRIFKYVAWETAGKDADFGLTITERVEQVSECCPE